ncbi:putative protein kinase RLK-Pelle-CrRLK1L-1 family [Helianthus debilis subsp. tardiflorus]
MLSDLKHKYLVSFIGFCDEKDEKIIINKHESHESLDKYLEDFVLTWLQRLQICVGIARALNYIHYEAERNYRVIHRNIKSSKILLDDNGQPTSFVNREPTSFANSWQSSFGEFMSPRCGMSTKSTMPIKLPNSSKEQGFAPHPLFTMKRLDQYSHASYPELLAQLAITHYDEENLDDIIDPYLRDKMDQKSFKIFSGTAYDCLKEQRAQRPNIDQILRNLEKALEQQMKRENPERLLIIWLL